MLKSFLILAMTVSPAFCGKDVFLSKNMHFRLLPVGDRLTLDSTVRVEQEYLSQRATSENHFYIGEYAHRTIAAIQAQRGNTKLDEKAFSYFIPQREDVFVASAKIHVITFPHDLRVHDRITYTYNESYESIEFFPLIEVPARNIVREFEIVIDHPQDVQVEFVTFSARQTLEPIIDPAAPGCTKYTLRNLPEPDLLPGDPFRNIQGAIMVKITRNGIPITPYSPEAFTTWYLGLLQATSIPSEAMKNLLSDELNRAGSRRAKVEILFNYVKSSIRYIADEGSGYAFIPHDCRDVFERKWGDCKGKARLLSVLADIHGLPVYMALVSTVPRPDFGGACVELFNHMICVFEEDGQLVFMDPTSPSSGLGQVPGLDRLMKALVLNPRNPRYVVVPDINDGPSLDIKATLSSLDAAKTARAEIRVKNAMRIQLAQAYTDLSAKAFESFAKTRLERLLPKLVFSDFKNMSSDGGEFRMESTVDAEDLFIASSQNIYVTANPFRVIDAEWVDRAKDSFTVNADTPQWLRLVADLPADGLRISPSKLVLLEVEPGLRAQAKALIERDHLQIHYEARQPFRMVPSAQRANFIRFCTDYLKLNQNSIVIQRMQ